MTMTNDEITAKRLCLHFFKAIRLFSQLHSRTLVNFLILHFDLNLQNIYLLKLANCLNAKIPKYKYASNLYCNYKYFLNKIFNGVCVLTKILNKCHLVLVKLKFW